MAVRRGGTFPIEVSSVTYGASLSVTTTLPQERTHGGRKGQGVHARARGAGSHASRHTHTHTHTHTSRCSASSRISVCSAPRMPTGSTHVLAPATRAPPWRASASASACSIVAPLHTCTYARARAHTHTHNTPTRAPREHTDSSLKPCDAGAPRPLASHQHRTPAPHMPRHAPVSLTTPGLAHERDGH